MIATRNSNVLDFKLGKLLIHTNVNRLESGWDFISGLIPHVHCERCDEKPDCISSRHSRCDRFWREIEIKMPVAESTNCERWQMKQLKEGIDPMM